ncbi:hypothetical protein Efla_005328 [Eimeria flavescens]
MELLLTRGQQRYQQQQTQQQQSSTFYVEAASGAALFRGPIDMTFILKRGPPPQHQEICSLHPVHFLPGKTRRSSSGVCCNSSSSNNLITSCRGNVSIERQTTCVVATATRSTTTQQWLRLQQQQQLFGSQQERSSSHCSALQSSSQREIQDFACEKREEGFAWIGLCPVKGFQHISSCIDTRALPAAAAAAATGPAAIPGTTETQGSTAASFSNFTPTHRLGCILSYGANAMLARSSSSSRSSVGGK